MRECLAGLEAANPGDPPPKAASLPDPAARYTAAPDGPAFFAYATNYLVDVEAGIIMDVEATTAQRTAEVNATRATLNRVEERFDLKPDRLIGDTGYGAAELLGWMVDDKAIAPHIPLWDRTQRRDGTLSSSDCAESAANGEMVDAGSRRKGNGDGLKGLRATASIGHRQTITKKSAT